MNPDELNAAVQTLQDGNETDTQHAYAEIAEMVRLDATECAPILAQALLAEAVAGEVRTPRLLTLLGLTRQPAPECVPLCLELLRTAATGETSLPADAMIGAAAVIARTDARKLLPDLTNQSAAAADDPDIAQALLPLLSVAGQFLRDLPENPVTDMARSLWADCAALDLMTLADIARLDPTASA